MYNPEAPDMTDTKPVTSPLRSKLLTAGLLLIVLAVIPGTLSVLGKSYYTQVANSALIYCILAASMNLITGTAGLLCLGHAAFFGIGAYTAALLATNFGLPFVVTLPLGGIVAGLGGVLVALPTMRLISIYFAVATLGVGEIIHVTLLNWVPVTRGPMGVQIYDPITIFGHQFTSLLSIYYVIAVLACISIYIIWRLTNSYFGNALRSVREDDQCAEAMGINVVKLKIQAFAISTFFAGLAGAIMAHSIGYISPDSFQFSESILILAMVVVGGLGSLPGGIFGALLLILLPEVARGLGDLRMVAVGVVMFLSILLLPKGIFGEVSAIDMARKQFNAAWGGRQSVGWK
ncbi:branched-chain amino acid ABC transporter permease [Pseudodesulfovibrio sediminis]|uniref:Branched-chain amino acid ABC transporter permease n=1 Tax=Pseudodesulfovibrio sediminis TaxID=2810563 RepID=A0ABN6EU49_9BACT|nr:branched-chain amino acid ABC transporter permease [Pseudodesulfovibrio sediminis]BCS89847.1 branched-chain amino acid ABC transporter permease [Pseudodesulfovibrio sediminis]